MKRESLRVYPILDLGQVLARGDGRPELLVAAALRGGATILQLRDKQGRGAELARLCQAVRPWLAEAAVPLVINDRIDLALALETDGVHLGQHDMPAPNAHQRARLASRDDLIIGVSVTTVEQANAAMKAGATYLSISPIFVTPTKVDTEPAAGLEGLRAVRAAQPEAPIVAIGGIKPTHVSGIIEAGADGVAFISAIGTHPEESVRAMARAVATALRSRGASP